MFLGARSCWRNIRKPRSGIFMPLWTIGSINSPAQARWRPQINVFQGQCMNKSDSSHAFTPELARSIYRKAYLLNRTDQRFRAMLTTGELTVAYYPVRGPEVTAAAALSVLQPGEQRVPTDRGLPVSLANGNPYPL